MNAGVLACASSVEQVSNYLTRGGESNVMLFNAANQPDRRIFSVSMELATPTVKYGYASASFAPNQANGCDALYETVVYWSNSCDEVAAKQFAALKRLGKLGHNTAVLSISPVGRVFLLPAGDNGCVAIKKELMP